jgi:hypothetical protein
MNTTKGEGRQNGLAICALILGIISFLTFGLLGVGAITGIILAVVAMGRVKREPWKYGGRGMAIAGLILSITSLATLLPVAIIAAIAIPNMLAARLAANEGLAIRSMQTISSAEGMYYTAFAKYGTLDELGAQGLIDSQIATGSKNGYNFSIELTSNEMNGEGFAATATPAEYLRSGRRSFYVDESMIVRAGDNHGAPSTSADAPLEFGGKTPTRAPVEYRPESVY